MNIKLIGEICIYFGLIFVALILFKSLIKSSRDLNSKINLEDLLIGEDGKTSKSAFVLFGSFALTSWMMIYLTYTGKMTDVYLGIYVGAFISPTISKIFTSK